MKISKVQQEWVQFLKENASLQGLNVLGVLRTPHPVSLEDVVSLSVYGAALISLHGLSLRTRFVSASNLFLLEDECSVFFPSKNTIEALGLRESLKEPIHLNGKSCSSLCDLENVGVPWRVIANLMEQHSELVFV